MTASETPAIPVESHEDPVNQRVTQRVRTLRKSQGWTLEQLATMSGVSKSMLSQIERGAANPTLVVAHRIAQAFGLSLGQFVDGPSGIPPIEVIRASDPSALLRKDQQCCIRRLSPLSLAQGAEFQEITLEISGVLAGDVLRAGTCKLLSVLAGGVRISSGADSAELAKGDSACFAADVPHRLENMTDGLAVVVGVILPPPSTGKR